MFGITFFRHREPSPPRSPQNHRLPLEILQRIFNFYLNDVVYSYPKVYVSSRGNSYRVLPFQSVVFRTEDVRGVCRSWATAMRSIVFQGKGPRRGILLRLPGLLSSQNMATFPLLRDCWVDLCHPYMIRELRDLQQNIAKMTLPLIYISAVFWREDMNMDVIRGKTSHMGYGPLSSEFKDAFEAECTLAGFEFSAFNDLHDAEKYPRIATEAIINFYLKEALTLWFYNAHLVRQILSAFPCLEYLALPAFLHVPLLKERGDFVLRYRTEEECVFNPVGLAPPRLVQNLGITDSDKGGLSYIEIMTNITTLDISTAHYNPIAPLFNYLNLEDLTIPPVRGFRLDKHRVARDIMHRLNRWLTPTLDTIPAKDSPQLLNVHRLRHVLHHEEF